MSSKYHITKDGRKAKKGLYYYMNRAKKRGTSKPGKGTVTDKALEDSAKTANEEGGFKSPAWTRKAGQSPTGGLNAKGRASAKKGGSNLKSQLSSGTSPRRVSFAARFSGMKGPMKKPNGKPTRKALALKKWGFGSVEAARNFANANKKKAQKGGVKYRDGGFLESPTPTLFED
tara:strand:+ start:4227 stop:4748 length:522 start_codon:yes stop_codon:yes gene_type:complete